MRARRRVRATVLLGGLVAALTAGTGAGAAPAAVGVATAPAAAPAAVGVAPAATATAESHLRPPDGAYTVTGYGYGHGIGLSAWGEQSRALAGQSAAQILAFYYPGTTATTTDPRSSIRVRLDAVGRAPLAITNTTTLTYAQGGGTTYLPVNSAAITPAAAPQLRLVPTAVAGVFDLQARTGTTAPWTATALKGLKSPVAFRDATTTWVSVTAPGSTMARAYRGELWLHYAGPTETIPVNRTALDDLVRGVVPSEVYTSWHPEALKTQAIASRTFAAYSRARSTSTISDTCDTTSCQVYNGKNAEVASTDAAVAATSGGIVTYAGKPALTMFSAANGGWSSDGGLPYLVARADPFDGLAKGAATSHAWTTEVSVAKIEAAFPGIGALRRITVTGRDGYGALGGRILTATVVGTRGSVDVTGPTLRWKFGLKSEWFTLSDEFFADVPAGAPFAAEIRWLYDQGITYGWSDGTYRPLEPIARESMAAFLYRFRGSPAFTAPAVSPFTDLTPGAAFYREITWLASTRITTGWPDRTFRPATSVTRDQMAAFLYRLAGAPAYRPPTASPFADVAPTDAFYREICWLASTGITTGWPDRTFRPAQAVSREAMAAFLYRYAARFGR